MTSDTTPNPKPKRKRAAPKRTVPTAWMALPRELVALCEREQVSPRSLLLDFVADLCDLRAWSVKSAYAGNGDAAHRAALAYHAVAQKARDAKAQARAAGVDVLTPQPQAETRATTPIEALAAAVIRDQKKDQP